MKKVAICILCIEPDNIHIDFFKKQIKNYDVYFLCDSTKNKRPNLNGINFIYIEDKECIENNFIESGIATIEKTPISWDKALYYFCKVNTNYEFVWFIEEDVFIPSSKTLLNIDKKYGYKDDLLVNKNTPNLNGDLVNPDNEWHNWYFCKHFNIKPPWYNSMVCAIRVSKKILNEVNIFVKEHKKIIFIEILFNTLCMNKNLKLNVIPELKQIFWKSIESEWDSDENYKYDEKLLYHPMKDIKRHEMIRNIMKKEEKSYFLPILLIILILIYIYRKK